MSATQTLADGRDRRNSTTWSAFEGESARAEKTYFDESRGVQVVKLYSGDCYVASSENEMLVTILGSCVAACIRDPLIGIGGMNHFLLPDAGEGSISDASRYGAFAMEELINGILKKGGRKDRLEVKVFGGANVINNSQMIGDRNCRFVRDFLRREGLEIKSEDLGGTYPRRINYYPGIGKVMMRQLQRKEDLSIVRDEQKFSKTITKKPVGGDVELF